MQGLYCGFSGVDESLPKGRLIPGGPTGPQELLRFPSKIRGWQRVGAKGRLKPLQPQAMSACADWTSLRSAGSARGGSRGTAKAAPTQGNVGLRRLAPAREAQARQGAGAKGRLKSLQPTARSACADRRQPAKRGLGKRGSRGTAEAAPTQGNVGLRRLVPAREAQARQGRERRHG